MRISTAYQFDSYSSGVSAAQRRVFEAERRVQTGKRLNRPGDDPVGAATVIQIRALKAGLDQYAANAQTAKGTLAASEQALGAIADLVGSAATYALRGATATTEQSERVAMASQVEQIQARLVDLANGAGPTGARLFAGTRTDSAPFSASGGALVYAGDSAALKVEVGPGQTITTNTSAQSLFGDAYTALESLRKNLLDGATAKLSTSDVAALRSAQEAIQQARGVAGDKLRTIETLAAENARRGDELTQRVSDLEEVDFSQAIMEYRSADSAYQAALTVAGQGFRLSLMDFIQG